MTSATRNIIDLFAGPGGWDEGLRILGREDVVGVEWDDSACATARTNGHARVQADITALNPLTCADEWVGAPPEGLIASPPCQAWSMAGKRLGEQDRAHCVTLADRMAAGDDSTGWHDWADPRSPLIAQPVRWVRELLPDWIALEEVPAVLSYWRHLGQIFEDWGYSTWVGMLNAADYGAPQKRRRAILVASRVHTVSTPPPTHARHPSAHLPGWVSMAGALGWGFDAEPAATVTGCGGQPFAGYAWRKRLAAHVAQSPLAHRDSIRLTAQEAGILQTFPADYAWKGRSKAQQFTQIGNAIPPLLATHVLRAAGAVDHPPDRADHPARQSVTPGRAA